MRSPTLRLAAAIAAAGVGWACRVPAATEPAEASPQSAARASDEQVLAEPTTAGPTKEELQEECLRSLLPGTDLNRLDLAALEAEVDHGSEESVRQFERLKASIAGAQTLCEERANAESERAVCLRSVDPEHADGCKLYPRTYELPVDLRAAPTAVVEIAELVRAYWMVERQHPDWPAQHGCPPAGSSYGDTGFVPPLEADCGDSPTGRCVAVEHPRESWEFPAQQLGPGTAWHDMGFSPAEDRLRFHYRFEWSNEWSHGGCVFQVEVRPTATRDDPSTAFTMKYAIDGNGMNAFQRFEPGMSFDDGE